jgi:hypothetical protein
MNSSPETNPNTEMKYQYNKADWDGFQKTLTSAVYPNIDQDLQEWYKQFRHVLQAANKHIPKSSARESDRHRNNKWWNDDCHAAQKMYRKKSATFAKTQNVANLTVGNEAKTLSKKTIA